MALEIHEELSDHTEIVALLSLVNDVLPLTGTVSNVINKKMKDIRTKRQEILFSGLASGDKLLTEDIIKQEDFLHKFVITYSAAINTRREEKIRMLAKLLKNSEAKSFNVDIDIYEEYLKILDELGYRELKALYFLNNYEKEYSVENKKDYWPDFINDLKNKLNLEDDEVKPFLNRLNSIGCFTISTGLGVTWEDFGVRGELSGIYKKIINIVNRKNKI